jgi:hypothetical protein
MTSPWSWTPKTEVERTATTPQVAFGAASMLLNGVEGTVGAQGYPLDEIVLTMGGLQGRPQYVEPRMTVSGPLKRWHRVSDLPGHTCACIQHWSAKRTFCCAPCHGPQLANPYAPSASVLPLSRSAPGRHLTEAAMQPAAHQKSRSSKAPLKYHRSDLVHGPGDATLLQAAGGLEPTSKLSESRGPKPTLLDLLFRVPRYCFTAQRD